ncbi:MAG: carbon-nitrogen hydrolase family protein [Acidobacteriota bacterium]|nr:carbon-nitrogen hydrolase family protein [Acidobacteriota bacterium]
MNDTLTVALVSDVFFTADGPARLRERLRAAKDGGAELAVLPEIPLNPWSPATATARDEDAEAPEGPRHRELAAAAREAGLGVLGGAIVRDPATGRRHNTALVFDARGTLRMAYRKAHLPEEPGFWETSHYEPGDAPPSIVDGFGLPFGVQICSDINRPEGAHLLGALGAMAIVNPRATEQATFARWRVVFVANALTSAAYVLSVNRPAPEQGVPLGGPSIAVAPDGEVLDETTAPVAFVRLERRRVEAARRAYPGYLPMRADLYARGWAGLTAK